MTQIEVEGRTLAVSSVERVLWPEAGLTKGWMLDYYARVAAALVPHVAGRPVTLGRFPEGVDRYGWYQTNCRGHPDWIRTRRVGTQDYCVLEDAAGLLWAANMGSVELHPLLASADAPGEPAVVVFDLDPGPPADVVACCRVAVRLRELLREGGLESFAKTTGSLGLHVYVPLNTPHGYEETKLFARSVAAALEESEPDSVTARPSRALRAGKVYVDWGQNDATKSTIAPYSLRGTPLPGVSTPLAWEEVERAARAGGAAALSFAPDVVLDRLERLGDLFRPVLDLQQTLPPATRYRQRVG